MHRSLFLCAVAARIAIPAFVLNGVPALASAQDATWGGGTSSDWTDSSNWNGGVVPGPTGTATFGPGTPTSITTGSTTGIVVIGNLNFNAPDYVISGVIASMIVTGNGINAGSGNSPTFDFINTNALNFRNMSTAGTAQITAGVPVDTEGGFEAGFIIFSDNSTAGSSTITTEDSSNTEFHDTSNAGNATLIAAPRGSIFFFDASNAAQATIINGGSELAFAPLFAGGGSASAGDATITTTAGAYTHFDSDSSGGDAEFITEAGGLVDISQLSVNGTTAGSIAGAGTYDLGSKQFVVGSNNLSTTVSGLIEDGGAGGGVGASLVKVGTGTLTLSGDTTYTGGTTISAGTLQLGDGGVTGSIIGDVTDNGTFAFNFNNSQTFSGLISGTGGVAQVGSGVTTLTAINTYGGPTTVAAGTLMAGTANTLPGLTAVTVESAGTLDLAGFNQSIGSLAGAGSVTLGSATLTTGADNTNTEFSGVISGAGPLDKVGTGTFILSGANTYTGDTTISAGTLQLGNGGTSGSVAGDVADNGNLAFDRSDIATFAGVVSGGGSVLQSGTGTTVITGANSYTGGTTISAGTLQLVDGGGTGSIVGDVTNNGALSFIRSDSVTFAGTISGTGAVKQIGSGVTILTADNTYTGPTTIASGTLQLGDGGTSGAVIGDIIDNGNLAFDRSDTVTIPGDISGTGSLSQIGAGTTILTGANTYIGGTTISAGALELGDGGTSGSIIGDITNNTALEFDRSDTVTVPGVVSGPGSVIQLGSGTAIVTGANTYTGGTTISAGTLQLGDGGTSGSIVGDVVDDGALAFNRSDIVTFPGIVSGTGSVSQIGTGTTVLTGANTYTGGTTISAGALQLGAGGTSGGIVGDVADNGVLAFNRSDTATFAGTISGTGAVNQLGSGTTILTADNTYTGPTTIGAGTLQLGDGGTSGGIVGDIVDNAALAFDRSDTVIIPGTISGGGSVSQVGGGTTILTGDNTYTGPTTIAAGTLQLGNGGASGSVVGDIIDDTSLVFDRSDTATIPGSISGTGAVTQSGPGTTILTGSNTYTGGTTISAGTLQLGDGGVAGSIVGDIADSGNLAFDRSDTVTFPGIVSGTGSVSQIGTGTTVLTGANTYTGGTTISAGTLQLGAGGTSGGIVGDVADNGVLAFNRSDTVTFAGTISGTGAVNQLGSGTTILTADNTYTGLTTISTGTLQLGNGGTSGGVIGNIADNTALVFDRSDTVIIPGTIFSAGAVSQIGSGTTILTADNSYTGGTTIAAGTLQLGNGGTSGGVFGDITDNGALVFDRSNTATIPGAISGTGSVSQIGTGTTVLTGADTFTGGTTITAGSLQLGDGGTSGSIVGDVADNANLAFDRSDIVTFPGVVSGTGSVSQIGAGTTILTADNTYTGGTTITAGTLQLGNGGASGGIVGDVADNGNLAFDRSDTVTFAGTISGTGAVNQIGGGTTILTADNTYTGPTTIAAGTLQLGNGGALGVVVGDIIDNAALVLDRSDTVTIPGMISGVGTVSQIGGGTTILTADNSYAGGTTISAGTLQLGSGGTSGSIVGDVADNGALTFDRSDTVIFAGAISGAGAVNQIGGGATILNATNPYSGPTSISRGTLIIGDASHPGASIGVGSVEIAPDATLGGFGSVGGSVVNDGAIVVGNALPAFAAGPLATFQIGGDLLNSGAVKLGSPAIGNVLAVRGNYVGQGGTVEISTVLNEGGPLANQTTDRLLVYRNASGTTAVQVNGTGAGAFTGTGQPNASDGISLIQVAGASSSGAFQLAGGYVTGGTPYQYRLYAFGPGSAIGPADPSQSLVGNPSGHWDYRLENVYVEPTGPVPPEPPNRPPPHDERLEVAPQVAAYLTAPLVVFNAGMQDLDSLHRRLGEIRDDQQLGRGQPGEVFARVYGGTYDYTSNLSFENYGYNVEQDYVALQFGANWIAHEDSAQTVRVGLAGTLGRLWFKPEAIDGENTGLMNTETLAGIATLQHKSGWYIDAILAGSWFDGNVSTADRGRTTKLDGSRFETSIEGGYPIALGRPGLAFEPQVQFVYQRLSFDNKTDVDGIDVAIGAPDQAMARIGARLTQQIVAGRGTLITPYLKVNYLQGIGGGDHEEIGGVVFGTGGYGQAFQVGGGATGTLGKSFSVYGDVAYQTHVGSGGFGGWSFNGGLRYVF